MKNIIKGILKYLFMTIGFGVVYGTLHYWTSEEVDIKNIIFSSIMFFIIQCVFAIITPVLRKLSGYKNN